MINWLRSLFHSANNHVWTPPGNGDKEDREKIRGQVDDALDEALVEMQASQRKREVRNRVRQMELDARRRGR